MTYRVGILVALTVTCLTPNQSQTQMRMTGTSIDGRVLFHSPAVGRNGLACIDCHADFDEKKKRDGRLRAGHSLINAASRVTWWGQDPEVDNLYPDIAHAAVVCVEDFMLNPDKLSTQQLLNLQRYLKNITRQPNKAPLPLAPAADKTGEYAGYDSGDKVAGRELFFAACHNCHPNGNAGIAPALPRDRDPSFYARKVRQGNGLGAQLSGLDPDAYDPAYGEFMPFFGVDRLSRRQLQHIIAFIRSLPPAP